MPYVFHRAALARRPDGTFAVQPGQPIRVFRRAWRTACRAAGVPGRILHDFRRAVRNLERIGVPRSAAMTMVVHKTESIYRRYAIVDAGVLRDAAERIDRAASTLSGTTKADSGIRTRRRVGLRREIVRESW